jgi:hypothetical protein
MDELLRLARAVRAAKVKQDLTFRQWEGAGQERELTREENDEYGMAHHRACNELLYAKNDLAVYAERTDL